MAFVYERGGVKLLFECNRFTSSSLWLDDWLCVWYWGSGAADVSPDNHSPYDTSKFYVILNGAQGEPTEKGVSCNP